MGVISILSNICLVSGAGFLSYLLYETYRFITLYLISPPNPLQPYKRSDTKAWAFVTGSSGGIGYGYARHLLSLDFGVIILAHEGIPEAEASLLKEYPNASIKSITMNCTTASITDIEKLVDSIKDLPITILINNVASIPMEWPPFREYKDFTTAGIDDTINLNSRFPSHLTRLMIPHLTTNARPRSLILNMSSGGRIGTPLIAIYSATKAYNASFSATLSREFRVFKYPIDCLAIEPGDVLSQGNRYGMQKNAPLANDYAKCVLERVDGCVRRDMTIVSPYWLHPLQFKLLEWLPEATRAREVANILIVKRDAWGKNV